jgi:hypothetical protein
MNSLTNFDKKFVSSIDYFLKQNFLSGLAETTGNYIADILPLMYSN